MKIKYNYRVEQNKRGKREHRFTDLLLCLPCPWNPFMLHRIKTAEEQQAIHTNYEERNTLSNFRN